MVEWLRQRADRDSSELFRGLLTSKSKGDLQEIVDVLGLSENSTAKDLQTRINAHFDAQPDLCESPQFIGLFNHACTSWPSKTTTNDASIRATHAQLEPTQHHSALTTNILNVMQAQPGPSNYYYNPYMSTPATQPGNPSESAASTYHKNTLHWQ